MTTGINPDVNPVARRWAAGLLGVAETASSVEARRVYLSKLRDSSFLPLRALPHAFYILDGREAPAERNEEWLLEGEGRLRNEVQAFAAEFFTIPVSHRRERWNALLYRCEAALPLTARLQSMKAGLGLEVKTLQLRGSFHGLLATLLLQLFPLTPLAQAASRQAFLRRIVESSAADRVSWEKAARYILAEWPTLASLDFELVQYVAKLRSGIKRKKSMRQRSQRQCQALHQRSQRQRLAPVGGGRKGSPWWLLLIPFTLLGGITSALVHHDSARSVTPSFSNPPDSSFRSVLSLQPTLIDLLDPSKYDVEVEVVGHVPSRIFRFTPRTGSTTAKPDRLQANNVPPIVYGEAMLRLLGVSKEQIERLVARAAEKRAGDAAKTPPGTVEPKPPKSAQGDKTHP